MKKKQTILLAGIAAVISIGVGTFLFFNQEKKAYDYTDFYEPKPNLTTSFQSTTPEPDLKDQVLSLSKLKERNSDVVAIIEFDERMIYEPIVQAKDNEYYVRKNIDKRYASAGISFISGDGSLDSKNVVIYGHSSTRNNIIFTPLMKYIQKEFYDAHPAFKCITAQGERIYQIFSVVNIDTNNISDSLEFTKPSWRNEESFNDFISKIKQNSLYQTNIDVNSDDEIMTLVTCDTRDSNKRVVVLAKRIIE